jgi:hypothetical protein
MPMSTTRKVVMHGTHRACLPEEALNHVHPHPSGTAPGAGWSRPSTCPAVAARPGQERPDAVGIDSQPDAAVLERAAAALEQG